jgi:hypothetical protein
MTKICKSCNRELVRETEFHKHRRCKDGYNPSCKDCRFNKINKNPIIKRNTFNFSEDTKIQRKLRNKYNGILKELISDKRHFSSIFNLSSENLRKHIENQFSEEMNWENRGTTWVIEHIIPLALFDLKNQKEIKMAYDLRNLRPMFNKENLDKLDYLPNGDKARDYRKMGDNKFKYFCIGENDTLDLDKFVIIKETRLKGQIISIDDEAALVRVYNKQNKNLQIVYLKDLEPMILYP